MESGWKLNKIQNIIRRVRFNFFQDKFYQLSFDKSAYARIQIFLSGIGGCLGENYVLLPIYGTVLCVLFGKYSRSTQTSYMLIYNNQNISIPGADSARLHRTSAGTEDGRETESGVYGRSAQGREKRHFLTIRK